MIGSHHYLSIWFKIKWTYRPINTNHTRFTTEPFIVVAIAIALDFSVVDVAPINIVSVGGDDHVDCWISSFVFWGRQFWNYEPGKDLFLWRWLMDLCDLHRVLQFTCSSRAPHNIHSCNNCNFNYPLCTAFQPRRVFLLILTPTSMELKMKLEQSVKSRVMGRIDVAMNADMDIVGTSDGLPFNF